MEVKSSGMLGKYMRIVCLIIGSVFLTFGCVFLFKFDDIYNYIVRSAMYFGPESEPFKAWRINDPPLILDYYFFNWTNSEEIYNKSVKPRFEQIGPYKFYEVKEKVNISWHENNTISYNYVKRYRYIDSEDSRSLQDKITTINPVLVTAAYKARFQSGFQKILTNMGFAASNLFVTKTVEELMFVGYYDTLLSFASAFTSDVPDKFGFFYKRNNSVSRDRVSMYTGQDEYFGNLLSTNYQNHSGLFPGSCGDIKGSAGEFLPLYQKPTFVEIYSPELCKYARLEFEKNVTVKGIRAYRFGSRVLFDNGTIYPSNECFCTGECIPSGVQNVSNCRGNSPTFLSLPHFYNADPYYLSLLEGLHPEKEKHELGLSVEPTSSVILDSSLRMQINMLLQPIQGFSKFQYVPKVFVPMFFFDQTVTLSDEILDKIKLIQDLPENSTTISLGIIISGSVLIGISIILLIFVRQKNKTAKYKINDIKKQLAEQVPLK